MDSDLVVGPRGVPAEVFHENFSSHYLFTGFVDDRIADLSARLRPVDRAIHFGTRPV